MIRSMDQLRARIESGATVSRLALYGEGSGFRYADTETGETVHESIITALEKRGEIKVISTDICGDPMQWGK